MISTRSDQSNQVGSLDCLVYFEKTLYYETLLLNTGMMMAIGKTVGSALIISGTAIGAGMLALPIVSHRINFTIAVFLLITVWALMLYCALLILEVTLSFKSYQNNFNTMTREILGRPGQIMIWLSSILLLYSLTAAYISGASSLLSQVLTQIFSYSPAPTLLAFLFTLIFGIIVSCGVRHVDRLNRGFMGFKVCLLLLIFILLTPHIEYTKLMTQGSYTSQAFWAMVPIFLTSFAFHHVIPSLANYLNKDSRALVRSIAWGASLPLVIYLLWLATILGIVPRAALDQADKGAETDIGQIIYLISQFARSKWASWSVNIFSDIALLTSFLGVTLGLFDFMADACKRSYTVSGRFQTGLITFLPPLLFAIIYPSGFILALGYAAIFVAIMQIIIPALMVWKKRARADLSSDYQAPGGKFACALTIALGLILILIQLGLSLTWL